MKRPPVKDLVKKIEEARGNISAMSRAYGRPRSTVQGWINASEIAKQALDDQRETVVDVAESVLFKRILAEDLPAVFYVLNNSRQAKDRGWGPRSEISGPDGKQIEINVSADDELSRRIDSIAERLKASEGD